MLTSKLEAMQARIRERWYPDFGWVSNVAAPWSEPTTPLSRATVALISTCGLYEANDQLPFDATHDLGDPPFRSISLATRPNRLQIAHMHYGHIEVERGTAVALPAAIFRGWPIRATWGICTARPAVSWVICPRPTGWSARQHRKSPAGSRQITHTPPS